MTEYILASKSPRRKTLLRNLIDSFLVVNPEVTEDQKQGESPIDYVLRIAREKAFAAGNLLKPGADSEWVILAADTIVLDGDKILGKPLDDADAARILTKLRGRTHQVFSGIAVFDLSTGEVKSRSVCSEVKMRDYTDKQIHDYIASGDPLDKAGAYAIQNQAFNPAPDFHDCYANVMGLPLCHLSLLLQELGKKGYEDVADRCQNSLAYQCPVFSKILSTSSGG
jgi:septum formation protein